MVVGGAQLRVSPLGLPPHQSPSQLAVALVTHSHQVFPLHCSFFSLLQRLTINLQLNRGRPTANTLLPPTSSLPALLPSFLLLQHSLLGLLDECPHVLLWGELWAHEFQHVEVLLVDACALALPFAQFALVTEVVAVVVVVGFLAHEAPVDDLLGVEGTGGHRVDS